MGRLTDRLARKAGRMARKATGMPEPTAKQKYIPFFERLPIEENTVILEARNGKTIDGNVYYLLQEIMTQPEFGQFRVYVVAFDDACAALIREKTAAFAAERMQIVRIGTENYYRLMASAKYIINDSAIRNFYLKKEGQRYLNVWHGTPFKTMGRRVAHEPHATGSVQKNFIVADYLLYPSRYMMEHMIEDYMIADLSNARILLGGYPRNAVFFDGKDREQVRRENVLQERRVYAYMPTWRPGLMGSELQQILEEMDAALGEEELLYVNVHPLAEESVDFSGFQRIRRFPPQLEVYRFLNAADVLITDYSSVFYDFAVTGRKIVLFTYDEAEYIAARGLYEPIDSLPFPRTASVPELIRAVRGPKEYDDRAFLEKYCPYENPDAAGQLARQFLLGEEHLSTEKMPSNGLDNVLVYGGDLAPGPRRDAVMEFLSDPEKPEANYYLIFNRRDVNENKEILLHLPEGIRYYGRTDYPILNPRQAKAEEEYEKGRCTFDQWWEQVKPAFARERLRYFGTARIDRVVMIPQPGPVGPSLTKDELELSVYL